MQNGVFPGPQSQVVGLTTAAPNIQPITRGIQTGITAGVGVGLGVGEIIIRVICTVFCIGILIPSAVTIPAINSVEESLEQRRNASREYENAGSYRSIAIYLVWISSLAMVLHIMMIIVRIFYLTMVMKKLFRIYVILNAIVCVLFGLSLLAGGIVSVIYASENGGLWRDLCLLSINFDFDDCSSLQSIVATEAVSGSLSFLVMILFGVLCLILICTYCMAKSTEQPIKPPNTYITQPQVAQSQEVSVSQPPTSVSTSDPPTDIPTPTAPSSSLLRENASHYLSSSSPDQSPTDTATPSAPTSSLLRGTHHSQLSQPHSRTNALQDLPPRTPRSTNVSFIAPPSAPPPQTINVSLHGSVQAPPYESTVSSEYNPQYVSLGKTHDEYIS